MPSVDLRVAHGLDYQGLLLMSANFPLQRLRDSFCDLALYGKNISQFDHRFRPDWKRVRALISAH